MGGDRRGLPRDDPGHSHRQDRGRSVSPAERPAPRLPPAPVDSDDPLISEVFGAVEAMGRQVPTLYQALGNSPEMLRARTAFARPLRSAATTSRALRELVIMRVAHLTAAPYEWLAHWDMAVDSGVGEGQLDAVGSWRQSQAFTEGERAALAAADDLTLDFGLSDRTWSDLAAHFDPGEIVELILTASFYSCVSRVLGALRLEYPTDDPRLAHFPSSSRIGGGTPRSGG